MANRRPLGEVSLADLVAAAKKNLAEHEPKCVNCQNGLPCPFAKRVKKQIRDFSVTVGNSKS